MCIRDSFGWSPEISRKEKDEETTRVAGWKQSVYFYIKLTMLEKRRLLRIFSFHVNNNEVNVVREDGDIGRAYHPFEVKLFYFHYPLSEVTV